MNEYTAHRLWLESAGVTGEECSLRVVRIRTATADAATAAVAADAERLAVTLNRRLEIAIDFVTAKTVVAGVPPAVSDPLVSCCQLAR
jgi:hypothetical protein